MIVFAPLGVYFLNNPSAFLTRIQQVAPRGDQAAALLENAGRAFRANRAVRMVGTCGDVRRLMVEPDVYRATVGIDVVLGLAIADLAQRAPDNRLSLVADSVELRRIARAEFARDNRPAGPR